MNIWKSGISEFPSKRPKTFSKQAKFDIGEDKLKNARQKVILKQKKPSSYTLPPLEPTNFERSKELNGEKGNFPNKGDHSSQIINSFESSMKTTQYQKRHHLTTIQSIGQRQDIIPPTKPRTVSPIPIRLISSPYSTQIRPISHRKSSFKPKTPRFVNLLAPSQKPSPPTTSRLSLSREQKPRSSRKSRPLPSRYSNTRSHSQLSTSSASSSFCELPSNSANSTTEGAYPELSSISSSFYDQYAEAESIFNDIPLLSPFDSFESSLAISPSASPIPSPFFPSQVAYASAYPSSSASAAASAAAALFFHPSPPSSSPPSPPLPSSSASSSSSSSSSSSPSSSSSSLLPPSRPVLLCNINKTFLYLRLRIISFIRSFFYHPLFPSSDEDAVPNASSMSMLNRAIRMAFEIKKNEANSAASASGSSSSAKNRSHSSSFSGSELGLPAPSPSSLPSPQFITPPLSLASTQTPTAVLFHPHTIHS
eukprot:MONOS_4283.1-p1 / transcript=MONOS_4283.1 / gene=MONOS_4283 / organism=Monocercomonoides_exilis_PA203 / gene_product=unspecified product / transcript_product=unspecified product / location=Mono_scaffold00112:14858-16501(-) / protein_length=480 / sequence_SO=supercontig / SO=protein_coding / is_pseudo=false